MSLLDSLIAEPDLVELDSVELAVPPGTAWTLLRHADLGRSPLTRALFRLRTIPSRLTGRQLEATELRIDNLGKDGRPGFRILSEDPGREVVVGAIGKVWHLDIPFADVQTPEAFRYFEAPGFAKVAWAIRVTPRGDGSHVEFELRVRTTDAEAKRAFRRYFAVIGPASHFIRRHLLASLARELGTPESQENQRSLPGDDLLPDAAAQVTHGITIHATPAEIWPWLVQMGCRRAGWYSVDALDNGGARSAREVHPELQSIVVGDVLPATPDSDDGFEVLALEKNRVLALGGLFDAKLGKQRRFANERPASFWHVTWVFVLEPLDERTTRLHVRGKVAFSRDEWFHALWIRPVHHFMQKAQLVNLAARAEGALRETDLRDVSEGIAGAGGIVFDLLTPFLGEVRSHWGVDKETARGPFPGDDLVATPKWSWTHGVEIEATPRRCGPWIAQIGADKGGFYSYRGSRTSPAAGSGTWRRRTRVGGARGRLDRAAPAYARAARRGHRTGRWFVAHAAAEGGRPDGKPG
jgi:hypothetical protein